MGKRTNNSLIGNIIAIIIIGCFMTVGLWFFERRHDQIEAVLLVSVLMLLSLLFLVIKKDEKLSEHPVFSLTLVVAYLFIGIILCFPNPTTESLGLYYLLMIPVAGLSGLSFSLVLLLGSFGIVSILDGLIDIVNIMYAFFALISCFQIFDNVTGKPLIKRFAVSTTVQAIIAVLVYGVSSDKNMLMKSIIVILLYLAALTVVGLIKSNNVILWVAFDYGTEDETPVNISEVKKPLPVLKSELSLDDLCKENNYYAVLLRERLPKHYGRSAKFANLCADVAAAAGADAKLVFSIAFYKELIKLKEESESTETYVNRLLIPDQLKKAIIRENSSNWHPADFEEIIVYAANGIISTMNYAKKNELDVSKEKIIDNTCTLLLKKGYARDCMISMSSFHRMKQGFLDNIK